jgi:60 kDa SS-A/Ro ribonucleoprotein
MRMNVRTQATPIFTHEGGRAVHINAEQQLRRSVMSCMLWEKTFYEDGKEVTERIAELIGKLPFEKVAAIAIEARTKGKLRHVPLFMASEATKHFKGKAVGDLIAEVCQRADEPAELLAIYWNGKKRPIAAQMKRGLARAVQKFDEYQMAKYKGERNDISSRDAIFLTHPRARNDEVGSMFARLVNKERIPAEIAEKYHIDPNVVGLASPETWENRLSRGEDKRTVFEEMINERKLGGLAMLRNLRNMIEAGVPADLIRDGLRTMKVDRVLPYRFIAAARYAKQFEPELEEAMYKSMEGVEKLAGRTHLLIDVSGSMYSRMSGKTEMHFIDAACGLAILARELSSDIRVWTFTDRVVEVPPRRGFALRDAIDRSQQHGGTMLGHAVDVVKREPADRLIVITDEQAHDRVSDTTGAVGKGYIVNVAPYKNGVGYGQWTHVDGFSEATLAFIKELEQSNFVN